MDQNAEKPITEKPIKVEPELVEPAPGGVKVEDLVVKVSQIKANAPGFLPLWLNLVSAQRALEDPMNADPEHITRIYDLLSQFITEPADKKSKLAVLNRVTQEELMSLLKAIMGAGAVPPANGGA